MANAFFLNATPNILAVNLNTSLQYQIVEPEIQTAPESVTMAAWKAPLASTPGQGVFGGNNAQNLLMVVSMGHPGYEVWSITSSISVVLNLYFYIMDDQIVGIDATGSTQGIVISPTNKLTKARVFTSVPPLPF